MDILTSQCPLMEMLHFRGREGALNMTSETMLVLFITIGQNKLSEYAIGWNLAINQLPTSDL